MGCTPSPDWVSKDLIAFADLYRAMGDYGLALKCATEALGIARQINNKPLQGASVYDASVYDGALNQVAKSGPITTTSWKVDKALHRGGHYIWMVSAQANGKEVLGAPASGA